MLIKPDNSDPFGMICNPSDNNQRITKTIDASFSVNLTQRKPEHYPVFCVLIGRCPKPIQRANNSSLALSGYVAQLSYPWVVP